MNHILSEFSQNYLPKRHSFILRLWQNNYDADWLIMVQEMDGEIVTFANLDELMAFLMEKMPASSPPP